MDQQDSAGVAEVQLGTGTPPREKATPQREVARGHSQHYADRLIRRTSPLGDLWLL